MRVFINSNKINQIEYHIVADNLNNKEDVS